MKNIALNIGAVLLALGVFVGIPYAAFAADSIYIVSKTPMYKTETLYENIEVCVDRGDNVLGGALLGGLIGNNTGSGDAAEGAILGGILGGLTSGESCHTERRVSGSRNVYTHTEYVISINGVTHRVSQ